MTSQKRWGAFSIHLVDEQKSPHETPDFHTRSGYVCYGNMVKLVDSATHTALPRLVSSLGFTSDHVTRYASRSYEKLAKTTPSNSRMRWVWAVMWQQCSDRNSITSCLHCRTNLSVNFTNAPSNLSTIRPRFFRSVVAAVTILRNVWWVSALINNNRPKKIDLTQRRQTRSHRKRNLDDHQHGEGWISMVQCDSAIMGARHSCATCQRHQLHRSSPTIRSPSQRRATHRTQRHRFWSKFERLVWRLQMFHDLQVRDDICWIQIYTTFNAQRHSIAWICGASLRRRSSIQSMDSRRSSRPRHFNWRHNRSSCLFGSK